MQGTTTKWLGGLLAASAIGLATATAADKPSSASQAPLSRPDGKPADPTRKVKVFILMGQSNMVGMGDVGPETNKGTLLYLTKKQDKYPWLLDEDGKWTVRKDVYYYDARVRKGSPLSALSNNGRSIGPELGFGFVMGQLLDEPVLVLKSCIGNRSLGWDLLPPGSERYEAEVTERGGQKVTKIFAGYKDKPDSWIAEEGRGLATEPPAWLDKKTGKLIEWYAGKQYDVDMANAKAALASLAKIYPDYKGQGYEIAGFVWWQGNKDSFNAVHAARYEQNLARLIPQLRKDYEAFNAKFVLATGCGVTGRDGLGLQIAEAQLAVGDAKKHPEFAGNVKAVDSRDLWRDANVSPKNQGYHYNRNAETFMEVGLRLGWAMTELLQSKP
ncbi:MAG TPA: sialate O-acetylesterase [Candidatus Paceibacterota bacterium]|nr:sialate O-acetylesterase [Candidatus Paceibacterota bacterium]